MNILPKKRWHVRTKENIARVRRDEAQAAEEEKEKERRIKLAEKEARRDLMRERARAKLGSDVNFSDSEDKDKEERKLAAESSTGHINFFADEEAGLASSTAVNKDHEEEAKQEREKYEKQIGYLTYLGQDTNEATGKVSWYNKCPQREEVETSEETGLKHKITSDPLNAFKKYCSGVVKKNTASGKTPASETQNNIPVTKKRERSRTPEERNKSVLHKHKKRKSKKHKKKHKSKSSSKSSMDKKYSSSSDSDSDHSDTDNEKRAKLEKLRAERLRREKEEKKKAEKLLAKVNGVAYVDEDEKPQPKPVMKQQYNSQFNPDIAKQNYDDQRYRF